MRFAWMKWVFLAMIPLWSAPEADAQADVGHCRAVANHLDADPHSEAFRWALTYGRAGQCGAGASLALVQILDARGEDLVRAGLVDAAVLQAAANRHPQVFEAALTLAADPTRSSAIRVAATQLALSEYDIGYRLPQDWIASPAPGSHGTCPFSIAIAYDYASETPLPSDARSRLLATRKMMQSAAGAPDAVRRAAPCVEYILNVAEGEDEPGGAPPIPQ